MPRSVGIRFAHAAVQVLAVEHGIDVLHIKGPAVDESLLRLAVRAAADADGAPPGRLARTSSDADVLVRPSHVSRLMEVMHEHGWTTRYRFEDGSAFEHAATLMHPYLAPLDVHRWFPGVGLDPEAAFDRLWRDRHLATIAGQPCAVPSVTAQRLILMVHAARGGVAGHRDVTRSWVDASDTDRSQVQRLATELRAEVAVAAATGRLDDFRSHREHALWALLSSGETSRLKLWAARVRAAPTTREAVRTGIRLVLPNPHRLAQALGRPPTARELAAAYARRARLGLVEVRRVVTDRRRRQAP